MSYEIRHLESTIYMLEDNLLRSKNQYEIERLQTDLCRLRRKLQTLKQRESR